MNSVPHPITGQPIGELVDATPALRPGPVTLQGRFGRVEKLDPKHAPALWQAVKGHDDIWTYMSSYGPFENEPEFSKWVAQRAALEEPYSYAIVDASNRPAGIFALMEIRPNMRVCEVGHVVFMPPMQRTPLATEALYLLARYAFETLHYRRFEWKCNSHNAASRRAALRYGFTYEFIMRQHVIAKGRNRDSAWFSMLDGDWPARKARLERWLAPENFDPAGRQKVSLSQMPVED